VTVWGGLDGSNRARSNLPTSAYLADSAFTVAAAVTGKVWNIQTLQVSGAIELNGAVPKEVSALCSATSSPDAAKVVLNFVDATKGYDVYAYVLCKDAGFGFTATLYPGTYRVTVWGGQDGSNRARSNLPTAGYRAEDAFTVAADMSGKVWNIQTLQVSGAIQLNGAAPKEVSTLCSTTNSPDAAKVVLNFADRTRGYDIYAYVLCKDAGFNYTVSLFPGTYRVTVWGGQDGSNRARSNLPTSQYLAVESLLVP